MLGNKKVSWLFGKNGIFWNVYEWLEIYPKSTSKRLVKLIILKFSS